jgi:putative protease
MGEWNNEYGSKATKRKIFIGKGVKYFKNIGVGEFKLESHSLSIGDEILITGTTTGVMQFIVDEIRVDEKKTKMVNKGEVFSLPVKERIRPSDKIYKLIDA